MSLLEMKVPTIGESVTEVTLSQWLKNDGDYVELDEPICEFESDKATLEFPAEAAGILKHVAAEGDDLEIGGLVAQIDTSAVAPEQKDVTEVSPKEESSPAAEKGAPSEPTSHATGHPSPAAAKMMRENSLKSEDIAGSGKEGRITKEDVQKAIDIKASQKVSAEEEASPKKSEASSSEPTQTALPSSFSREVRREKMSRMRRTIAKRLVSAKNNTAMLTTFNEVDLTEVIALRKKYQEQFVEKYGIKLGFMSIFSKACAQVLMEMPAVNAQLDGESLIYHDYADISIAISTPSGLVVPPVHNVESLDYHEIELKIKELAVKARDGKLTIKEMQGGTFTITNGGIFGSMMSTPILNEPQSAILGMHTIQQRPMAINGEVKIRPMMYLALSYDHRVIDGSTSVTFLVKVKKLLEDPITLFLGI
jgi:2-oxoglutarate dehydrogenase E2 component (dihydrolipoamide succinyltransferase)